jgi:hypothetical protein
VPAYGPPGILVAHDLLGAPRGPQQLRSFASRKPAFARFGPGRQRDRHDLRAKPLPPVVIDRRSQILELTPGRAGSHHARRLSSSIRFCCLPRLSAAVIDIRSAVCAVHVR